MTLCERCGKREACRVIGATRIETMGEYYEPYNTGRDEQAPLAALGLLRHARRCPVAYEEWVSQHGHVTYWQHDGWLELCAECYGRVVR